MRGSLGPGSSQLMCLKGELPLMLFSLPRRSKGSKGAVTAADGGTRFRSSPLPTRHLDGGRDVYTIRSVGCECLSGVNWESNLGSSLRVKGKTDALLCKAVE